MVEPVIPHDIRAARPLSRVFGLARWTVLCLVFVAAAVILGCVAAVQPGAALATSAAEG